jgi:hypothetical protein
MRYKNIALDKITSLEVQLRSLEANVSRYNTVDEVRDHVRQIQSKLEELKKTIEIEDNTFPEALI